MQLFPLICSLPCIWTKNSVLMRRAASLSFSFLEPHSESTSSMKMMEGLCWRAKSNKFFTNLRDTRKDKEKDTFKLKDSVNVKWHSQKFNSWLMIRHINWEILILKGTFKIDFWGTLLLITTWCRLEYLTCLQVLIYRCITFEYEEKVHFFPTI